MNNKYKVSYTLLGLLFLLCVNIASVDASRLEIVEPVDKKLGGAAEYQDLFNIKNSPYYKAPDYYNGKVSDTLILLEKFKTYQQTSERSCGAAVVLMSLDYLGVKNVSENQLDKEIDIRYYDTKREDGSFGATTASIAKALKDRGFKVTTSVDTQNATGYSFADAQAFADFIKTNLKQGNIILVENIEWGGHWRVIIGYDDMGTPLLPDDILVFADPYDTTDHLQDGYTTDSFQRFFYTWFDNNVLPKNEKIQQYVLIEKPNKK